jgi:hypothetical protein
MKLGILTLHIHLAGNRSLKDKRSQLKRLIARLQKEFNVSVAEIDLHDKWTESVIACGLVSNEQGHVFKYLQRIVTWLETNWPEIDLIEDKIELIQ